MKSRIDYLKDEIPKYERLANQIFYHYHTEARQEVEKMKKELSELEA